MDKDHFAGAAKSARGHLRQILGRLAGKANLAEAGRKDLAEAKALFMVANERIASRRRLS